MKKIIFLNGQFIPLSSAAISPLDRGFLFGDGVYEVIRAYQGNPFSLDKHLARLNRSLAELKIANPYTEEEWRSILTQLLHTQLSEHQSIYIQITRGTEPKRAHAFSSPSTPTVFAMTEVEKPHDKLEAAKGVRLLTVCDQRWKNCHIKTTARVAYVLMAQEAKSAGFDEALITNNGYVLEGSTSNVFIVRHGILHTPPESSAILSGVTRSVILELAEQFKIPYRETKLSERDCQKADEIWITSSTRGVRPVIQLDNQMIGNGQAGPLWEQMWDKYVNTVYQLSEPIPH